MAPAATIDETNTKELFPRGGWDTHHHIFEPATFPYSADRHLTPCPATIQAFQTFKTRVGLTRSVLTHGLSYGDDCTSLKFFIQRLGPKSTRGIGVIDPITTKDEEIQELHNAGVRGIRVNLYRYRAMENVNLQKEVLLAHLQRITNLSLPWSLTMTTIRTDFWDELEPFVEQVVARTGVPLITDHFALLKAPSMLPPEYRCDPTTQPGFQPIMRLVSKGHLWVKLSAPYRVSERQPAYEDLKFLVRAFVNANKHRVLWGSDWPHTPRMKIRSHEEAMQLTPNMEVDDEAWLRILRTWLSEEEWDLLMVENPTRLFM
ncbi:Amidohydrolase 2 [Pleurostoma richardsiae]|uniref:Amidohydrolase 2 n=1 Tax=Pleurostoma richardsiae TaxID=41990 RepID=A0AA38VTA9_9PEZI|nr:Amidohydrolase 2 [Pleurostoma richardsiae]